MYCLNSSSLLISVICHQSFESLTEEVFNPFNQAPVPVDDIDPDVPYFDNICLGNVFNNSKYVDEDSFVAKCESLLIIVFFVTHEHVLRLILDLIKTFVTTTDSILIQSNWEWCIYIYIYIYIYSIRCVALSWFEIHWSTSVSILFQWCLICLQFYLLVIQLYLLKLKILTIP